MDPLRDQHPAAVAGERAAARLVVVALWSPQADHGGTSDDAAEIARGEDFRQFAACRAEAVLQDDAERHAGGAAAVDEFDCARGADVERLFHQHVLARRGALQRDVAMGVGRREDGDRIDRVVRENGVEAVAQRKGKPLAEGFPTLGARAEGVCDLDLVGKVHETLGVRRHGHAEANDGDACLHSRSRLRFVRGRTSGAARG